MKTVDAVTSLPDPTVTPGGARRLVTARPGSGVRGAHGPGGSVWKILTLGNKASNPMSPIGHATFRARTPQAFNRPGIPTFALPLPDMSLVSAEFSQSLGKAAKTVEEELVVESGLHVVGVAAGGCYERFGVLSKVAPPLVQVHQNAEISDDAVDLAMCVTTPTEIGEGDGFQEEIQRSLEDLASGSEVRLQFECILDSLAEMALSESDEKVLQYARPSSNRRRRIYLRDNKAEITSSPNNTDHYSQEQATMGNAVPINGCKANFQKVLPPM